MNVYMGPGDKFPCILNIDTGYWQMVSFTLPRGKTSLHNMNATTGGPQIRLPEYHGGNQNSHAGKRIRQRYLLYLETMNSDCQLILLERKFDRQEIMNK
jgi:hypothetical protein